VLSTWRRLNITRLFTAFSLNKTVFLSVVGSWVEGLIGSACSVLRMELRSAADGLPADPWQQVSRHAYDWSGQR